jgi:endonuclease I
LIELKKENESRHGDNRKSRTDNNNVVPVFGRPEVLWERDGREQQE